MSNTTERAITIELSQVDRESAFGDATDAELVDTDIDASLAKLDQLTLDAVKEYFPEAEVEIGQGFHVWPETWFDEAKVVAAISELSGHIHSRGDWIVYR